MVKTIEQSVRFSASAAELFDLFLSPKRHAAFTGHPVEIDMKPGSRFKAFGGMIWGTVLYTVPGKLLVQRWRSVKFYDTDLDSILILRFVQDGQRGRIDLTHTNIPKQDRAGINAGWEKHYWKPLRAYLKKHSK